MWDRNSTKFLSQLSHACDQLSQQRQQLKCLYRPLLSADKDTLKATLFNATELPLKQLKSQMRWPCVGLSPWPICNAVDQVSEVSGMTAALAPTCCHALLRGNCLKDHGAQGKGVTHILLAHKSPTHPHCIPLSHHGPWPRGLGPRCVGLFEHDWGSSLGATDFMSTSRSLHIYSTPTVTLLCCLHSVSTP